jgi:hypothetical protein
MVTASKSTPSYAFCDKPTLKDLQSGGYAEVYARNNEEHFKHDTFFFVQPTIEEMETACSSASRDDNDDLCVRGVTYEVDLASADLGYKATVFRLNPNGEEFYVEPVYEHGRIIDLIWSTADLDEWGFTTGRGAVLGARRTQPSFPFTSTTTRTAIGSISRSPMMVRLSRMLFASSNRRRALFSRQLGTCKCSIGMMSRSWPKASSPTIPSASRPFRIEKLSKPS